MRTIETTLYDFNELSTEAKQVAIQKWYENEDYPWLENDMREFLNEKDPYFYDKKIQYSLCYCQGDGLSFSSKFDLEKWLNEKTELKASVKKALCELVQISSRGNCSNHYPFASRSDIEMDFGNNYKEYKNIERLADIILAQIQTYYMDICKEAESYGYSVIEYRMTESEFDELCQANEYEFTEDGKLA